MRSNLNPNASVISSVAEVSASKSRGFESIATEYATDVRGGIFGASVAWVPDSRRNSLALHRSSDAWSVKLDQSPTIKRVDFLDETTGASLGSVFASRLAQSDAGAGQRYDVIEIPFRYTDAANVIAVIHADLNTGEEVVLRTRTKEEIAAA